MNRKIICMLLCLGLLACILPAGAYTLDPDGFTIWPNEETYQFWETYRFQLMDQGIYEVAADNWNFCGEFHDGLVLIHENHTNPTTLTDNYVDKNGNLVDLNRNRYSDLFPFSEGYAAAFICNEYGAGNQGQTFIDTKGNQIVDIDETWRYIYTYAGPSYAGRFENGRALVMRHPKGLDYGMQLPAEGYPWYGVEYAYIDTKGNYLTDWTLEEDLNKLFHFPLYDQNGVWIGHRLDEAAWTAAAGTAQGSTGQPQEEAFRPDWHAPELPDYNWNAPSQFASTAKVTGFYLGDLDFGSAEVTVTNPTKQTDAGVVAVAFVNVDNSNFAVDGDGVFFIPYELAPGESKTYSVLMTGIFNQKMFTAGGSSTYGQQLAGHVASTVFTFEGEDDLWNFYETIPYEQFWYPHKNINEFQPICDSQPGTDWLASVAGIRRPAADLQYFEYTMPDGSRPNAAAADHETFCRK